MSPYNQDPAFLFNNLLKDKALEQGLDYAPPVQPIPERDSFHLGQWMTNPPLAQVPREAIFGESAVDDTSSPLPQDRALQSKYGKNPQAPAPRDSAVDDAGSGAPFDRFFHRWAKTQGIFGKID